MIRWAELVEAVITSISFAADAKAVEISLLSADGLINYKIRANGVDDFVANEARLRNIVDEVILFDAADATAREKSVMRELARFHAQSEQLTPVVTKQLRQVAAGALFLLRIEPVHGAALLVLAQSVSVQVESGTDLPGERS